MKKIFLYITVFLCISIQNAQATDETERYKTEPLSAGKIDHTRWENTTKTLDYGVKRRPKTPDQPVSNGNSGGSSTPRWESSTSNSNSTFDTFSKFALIGLIVLAVGFLAYRIALGGLSTDAKVIRNDDHLTVEEIEKNLHEADIKKFLRSALEQNNFRLAVRLYYLEIMKELSLKGKIEWQRDKTNGAYLIEMRKHPDLYEGFTQVTRIFEYAWYNSQKDFTQAQFEQVSPIYNAYLQKVS